MLKKNRNNQGMGTVRTWETFKDLFLQQFLPGNFQLSMRQGMYRLRQRNMSVSKYKSKYNDHCSYFPSWNESDRIEYFIENLKDSIKFKVSAYAPNV